MMEVVSNFDLSKKNTNKSLFDLVEREKLNPQLKVSLMEIIKEEKFTSFELETNFIEPSGGNFLGELYEVQIKGNTEEGPKEINLFIKSALPLGNQLDFIWSEEMYARETFVYTKISDIFEDLQSKANIPHNERFEFAKIYKTSNKNALIMENLILKGFEVPKRTSIPSLSFCEIAMKQLAKFHALSFVIKKEMAEFFEMEIVPKRILYNYNETFLAMVKNVTQNSVEALENDEAKKRVEKYIREVDWLDRFNYHMNTNKNDVNVGVFCHGDYRVLNIMMREKDGVCTEILPLDYQLTHYGHPVNDIIFFIVGASDKEFRRRYMDHLTSLYYDTLENYLLHFNMNIEDIYPRKLYRQDLKDRLDFGIIIGLYFFNFFYAPEDDFPDLNTDLTTEKLSLSDIGRRCINELVDDFIEWNIL